ncbi:MAG: chromate resistance protein ChrB domain-containing protein [Thermoanaerobaculia bacterium]
MRWYVLVHQIPPEPAYLRAKIGQRLSRVGALPIKNSVYVLPLRPDCLEDFQWIAQEAEAGGGEAFLLEARFTAAKEAEAAVARFRAARQAEYRSLGAELRALDHRASGEGTHGALGRLRRRFEEIAQIDFFSAPGRKEAESMMQKLEWKLSRGSGPPKTRGRGPRDLVGRTWVTRRGVKVDRIASAWLVRRFVDPRARFRFVDPKAAAPKGSELRFDMVDGDFTHEGDRCTFETLVRRAGIQDPAVAKIAEIVHDIDLKDGKYGRPETTGIHRLIEGVIAAHASDPARVKRGAALLDDLYASYQKPARSGI